MEKERDAFANKLEQAKRDKHTASELAEARLVNELQMRHSLNYVSWKLRKEVAAGLRAIYTAATIESLNMSLRKITKNRGSFPSDEALLKLFYLAQQNISRKWTMPIRNWKAALKDKPSQQCSKHPFCIQKQ